MSAYKIAGSWGWVRSLPRACAQVVHWLLLSEQPEFALGRSATGNPDGTGSPVAELIALGSGHLHWRTHSPFTSTPSSMLAIPALGWAFRIGRKRYMAIACPNHGKFVGTGSQKKHGNLLLTWSIWSDGSRACQSHAVTAEIESPIALCFPFEDHRGDPSISLLLQSQRRQVGKAPSTAP